MVIGLRRAFGRRKMSHKMAIAKKRNARRTPSSAATMDTGSHEAMLKLESQATAYKIVCVTLTFLRNKTRNTLFGDDIS